MEKVSYSTLVLMHQQYDNGGHQQTRSSHLSRPTGHALRIFFNILVALDLIASTIVLFRAPDDTKVVLRVENGGLSTGAVNLIPLLAPLGMVDAVDPLLGFNGDLRTKGVS